MGVSTNASICYGVWVGDETLPWQKEDLGLEDWWFRETGFVRKSPPIYNEDGNYINGVEPPKDVVEAYHEEENLWMEDHPIPFELENACSSEYSVWILAVPGTRTTARRGHPVKLEYIAIIDDLVISTFREFIRKYEIDGGECWWLYSYWG